MTMPYRIGFWVCGFSLMTVAVIIHSVPLSILGLAFALAGMVRE